MSFKKSFRAAPVRLGPYHRASERRKQIVRTVRILGIALVGGIVGGSLMALYERGSAPRVAAIANLDDNLKVGPQLGKLRSSHELVDRDTPQQNAYWPNCTEARAAGVAPIYAGESGYRPQLDRDNDGIACEPYRGR